MMGSVVVLVQDIDDVLIVWDAFNATDLKLNGAADDDFAANIGQSSSRVVL